MRTRAKLIWVEGVICLFEVINILLEALILDPWGATPTIWNTNLKSSNVEAIIRRKQKCHMSNDVMWCDDNI